jgi:hypothetical protein
MKELQWLWRHRKLRLVVTPTEGNLWMIVDVENPPVALALVLVYVDDILVTGSLEVICSFSKAVQSIWKTSTPSVLLANGDEVAGEITRC